MLRLLLISLAALLVGAAPASASSASVGGGILSVTADDGEVNDLLISATATSGTYLVAERGPLLTLRRGAQCSDNGGGVARCAGVSEIRVDAGDGGDVVALGPTIAAKATITDGAGDDRVTGGGGNDVFVGSPGDDVLDGGAGNDSFGDAGGLGADTLVGGPGTDTANYSARGTALVVSSDDVPGDGAPGEGDDVRSDVEVLLGGPGADRLTGGDGNDTLRGNGGDDVLDGGRGSDVLEGGSGEDTADYRTRTVGLDLSNDGTIGDGAPGENDTIGSDVERMIAGSGNDTLTGGRNNDILAGGDGNDRLRGNDGDDVLEGGAGADTLDGASGTDTVDYSSRAFALDVDLAAGRGAEGDTLTGIDGVLGGSGDDRLRGNDAAGRFDGGPGNDWIDGRGGADRMAGGSGFDHVDYSGRRDDVDVNLDDGANDGERDEKDDVRRDVESVTTGSGDDWINGSDKPETLSGGSGDDELYGKDGDDTLTGGAGDDKLYGSGGNDVARGGAGDDRVNGDDGDDALEGNEHNDNVNGGAGNDRLDAGAGNDQAYGADGNDSVEGGSGNDTVSGGNGDDTLSGSSGDDKVNGEDGSDVLEGGDGNDTVNGNNGGDRAGGGAGSDQVWGGDGDDVIDGGTGRDKVGGGSGADTVFGGADDDNVNGDGGDDRLDGGEGNDELSGGGGDDVLVGGPGADRMRGDDGEDTVDYGARTEPVRLTNDGKSDDGEKGEDDDVESSIDHAIGGAGNDAIRFDSDWPHRLYGEGGDDQLVGGPKNDLILGGPGNDQLTGAKGVDRMDGGIGNDRLAGADGEREELRCGLGVDAATRDSIDKAVGCERTTIGVADDGVSTPAGNALAKPVGTRRSTAKAKLVVIPGSVPHRADRRILGDLEYLKAAYNVAVAGTSGHGLVVDLVPGESGSWADVDRLARWAEPRPGRARSPFQKVSYAGDAGFGRGAKMRIAWRHGKGRKWVRVLSFARKNTVKVSDLRALARKSNQRLGTAPAVKTGLRELDRCKGAKQLLGTFKKAAKAFRLNWRVLSAMTASTSGYGCNMGPTPTGQLGWTHFTAQTWKVWGMDADGNGSASPYSSADAIFATARRLRAGGAPKSYRKALKAFSRDAAFPARVMARAKKL